MSRLRDYTREMKNNDLVIHIFDIKYNIKGSVVINISKDNLKEAKRIHKYIFALLSFVKYDNNGNICDRLDCFVDNFSLYEKNIKNNQLQYLDRDKIRDFFELKYNRNDGFLDKQLLEVVNQYVPLDFKLPTTQQLPKILEHMSYYGNSDVRDINKIYLNHIKVLGKDKKRSEFMSQKAKLLNPKIFDIVKDDEHATFSYYREVEKLRTDEEIIRDYMLRIIK